MSSSALWGATYAAIAQSLRDFGYPDVKAGMVADVHGAMLRGESLPHGIVGMFAARQLRDAKEALDTLAVDDGEGDDDDC